MTSEEWRQIEEIFNAVADLSESERCRYLESACAGDAQLRQELESLLLQDLKTGPMFKTMISNAAGSLNNDDISGFAGTHIGPYKIQRLIAQGGMAEVYSAVRDDDQYKKLVAIKLIRNNRSASFLIGRFWHERQILANLEHPSIARFLEGGTTEQGIPYLVMEYIEGEPITDYCKNNKLSTEQRLELFRSVCEAVQYAHRNLVIHRDLKPSNILVTPDGIPKLLDFGIAKLLNTEVSSAITAETITTIRVMTPEYASPEQVRGEKATTATDVYSLGVLLYEILTGERPYQFDTNSLAEIERIICQQEPDRPSTAVMRTRSSILSVKSNERKKLSREFARELDNIVLMAMQKTPTRRYLTAQQLGEDIERYLSGRPVRARTPTLGYRAIKFASRHKFAVSCATLLVLFAMLFVAGIIRERSRAKLEAGRAKAVKEFLQMTLVSADPFRDQGRDITLVEALRASTKKISDKLQNEPEIEAEVRDTIGLTFLRLGSHKDAEPQLAKALEIRRKVYGKNSQYFAATLDNLGTLYQEEGKLAESEKAFREALAIREQVYRKDHREIAQSLNNLAVLLRDEGKIDEAEQLHREALAMRKKIFGTEHQEVATSLNNLASILFTKGDLSGAESMFREVLRLDRKRWGDEHPNVAVSMNNLAFVLERHRKLDESESLYRKILEMNTKLLGEEHPLTATGLNNLGGVLMTKGNLDQAEIAFKHSLTVRRKVLPPEHPHIAITLNNLGQTLMQKNKCNEAEPLFREALRILEKSNFDPSRKAKVKSNMEECVNAMKKLQKGDPE